MPASPSPPPQSPWVPTSVSVLLTNRMGDHLHPPDKGPEQERPVGNSHCLAMPLRCPGWSLDASGEQCSHQSGHRVA